MSVIYVKEQGAFISKSGERIEVTKNNMKLLSFPVSNVDGLSIIGNVQISMQAMAFLMEHGVDITIFSRAGKLIGRAGAESSKNIYLRFSQYDLYQNLESRLFYAKAIVTNKIKNQIAVIEGYRFKDGFSPKEVLEKIEILQERSGSCTTTNELMGMEGMSSNLYFSCFSHMIHCSCEFQGRNRRPPRDPVNVILFP